MAVSDRAPAQALRGGVGLVLVAITSLQFGAALARRIFDHTGPAGTALLRALFAAVILQAIWRSGPRGYGARDLRLVAAFGLVLGTMNLCIYESIARIPLGIAVTIEFAGPLGVAVALSRRRLDLVCAALAALGILLLADPSGGGVDALGIAFALIAAACWAAYILIAQAAGRIFTGGRGVALAMSVAVLVPLVPGIAQAGGELADELGAALLAGDRGAAAVARQRVRRAHEPRARRGGARRVRGPRPGPERARHRRHRARHPRQRPRHARGAVGAGGVTRQRDGARAWPRRARRRRGG
jgi:threonine/homoserine efflux transporter RhtA